MKESISICGVGRLGGALAIAFARKHYFVRQLILHNKPTSEIAGLISPTPQILDGAELEKISADVIFITTPDSEIERFAENLAKKITQPAYFFHTSGALSSEILRPLAKIGGKIGSIHPLVSISDSLTGAENFKNAFFCVEGEPSAVSLAKRLVADLEGRAFTIPAEFKSLYHAAAVMTSGHLVALFSLAVEMLETCGLERSNAREILLPLVESTLKNLSALPTAAALTGPFARADVETLRAHLDALRQNAAPQALEIYLQLGLRSLHLAQEQEARRESLAEMKRILLEAAAEKVKVKD